MNALNNASHIEIPWANIFSRTIDQPLSLPKVLADFGITKMQLSVLGQKSLNDSEPYGRKILFQDKTMEVVLASWSSCSLALPHNHGAAKGMIWYIQGHFIEQHFRFKDRQLVASGDPRSYKANDVVTVDASDIHSCYSEDAGLSLHIYSPPIRNMKVWDEDRKRTLTVKDNCGAWIPQDQKLIVSENNW